MNLHHQKNMMRCNLCPKAFFPSPEELASHILLSHKIRKKSKPDIPDKANKKNKKAGKKDEPEIPKPFQCHICQRSFSAAFHLTEHLSTHVRDSMPYQCSVCQQKFLRASSLAEHKKIHVAAKEKEKECAQCNK